MEGISDIHITGFDATRPPRILKEPYINLYFELTHKAPEDWCKSFNHSVTGFEYATKIDPTAGLIIESWVRKPEEIESLLQTLKESVHNCNEAYIERVRREASDRNNEGSEPEDEGEQGRLNRIVAGLDFSEV